VHELVIKRSNAKPIRNIQFAAEKWVRVMCMYAYLCCSSYIWFGISTAQQIWADYSNRAEHPLRRCKLLTMTSTFFMLHPASRNLFKTVSLRCLPTTVIGLKRARVELWNGLAIRKRIANYCTSWRVSCKGLSCPGRRSASYS